MTLNTGKACDAPHAFIFYVTKPGNIILYFLQKKEV